MKFAIVNPINPYQLKLPLGQEVALIKESSNEFDNEAIKVVLNHERIGYVANSINTVPNGCYSAGRLLDKIEDGQKAKVIIISNVIIAEVI